MRVVGFIGSSGTGKSHRALWVAHENKIRYLVDDGLLIHDNTIVAGISAKRAPTRIGSIKAALFFDDSKAEIIRNAIAARKPDAIMILGTSEGMVQKIASVLRVGPVTERIFIQDVASEQEIEQAISTRTKQGKHVIPAPSIELKKHFSGYFLDPLQIFRRKGSSGLHQIGEKTVVRPTFSYFGRFIISDQTIYQVINHLLEKEPGISKMTRFRTNTAPEGLLLDMDLVMRYGYSMQLVLERLQLNICSELDRFAGLVVRNMQIHVKGIEMTTVPDDSDARLKN